MGMARDRHESAVKSQTRIAHQQRFEQLRRLENRLEIPMLILAFAWLGLLVAELTWGESPWLEISGAIIWIIFIVDFSAKLVLAPHKLVYLKQNWLTAIALLIPALRIFRIFRVIRLLQIVRVGRGLKLLRILSSLNRSMNALGTSLKRRGFGYAVTLTVLVTLVGAAGIYAFEKETAGGPQDYGTALWWTAMMMTTMGSQFWPYTAEGRMLCLFLALYAFAVFGYVTATLASFFVGRDSQKVKVAPIEAKQLAELRDQVIALREEIRALSRRQ